MVRHGNERGEVVRARETDQRVGVGATAKNHVFRRPGENQVDLLCFKRLHLRRPIGHREKLQSDSRNLAL